MVAIEKTTISLGRAFSIMIFVISTIFGVYQAAMKGVSDGFEKANERTSALEKEVRENQIANNLRFQSLEINLDHTNNNVNSIKTYLSEGSRPEDVRLKNYNTKRN